jgi:hypothetical protein
LQKEVNIRKRSDKLKYEGCQQMLQNMWKSQKEVRGRVDEIEERVTRLEYIMGSCNPLDLPGQ